MLNKTTLVNIVQTKTKYLVLWNFDDFHIAL